MNFPSKFSACPPGGREERSTSDLAVYLSNGLAVIGKACGVRLVPFE